MRFLLILLLVTLSSCAQQHEMEKAVEYSKCMHSYVDLAMKIHQSELKVGDSRMLYLTARYSCEHIAPEFAEADRLRIEKRLSEALAEDEGIERMTDEALEVLGDMPHYLKEAYRDDFREQVKKDLKNKHK